MGRETHEKGIRGKPFHVMRGIALNTQRKFALWTDPSVKPTYISQLPRQLFFEHLMTTTG